MICCVGELGNVELDKRFGIVIDVVVVVRKRREKVWIVVDEI